MNKAAALLLASWRAARSYRLRLVLSALALMVTVVPVWYAATALQPLMASKIQGQGHQYFAFLLVGMSTFSLLTFAVTALPTAVANGIGNGSLESFLCTPIRFSELLAGLVAYDFAWALVRASLVIGMGAIFGADFVWGKVLTAIVVVALILAAYMPIGLIGAALMLAFRTSGPLPQAVLLVSGLLGGVYFPTHVVPSWIQSVSVLVPLTYGLRALRGTLIDGAPVTAIASDVGILSAIALVLGVVSVVLLSAAMRHVRRTGTLAHD
jgi:ABC-2 type transport system permease protein